MNKHLNFGKWGQHITSDEFNSRNKSFMEALDSMLELAESHDELNLIHSRLITAITIEKTAVSISGKFDKE